MFWLLSLLSLKYTFWWIYNTLLWVLKIYRIRGKGFLKQQSRYGDLEDELVAALRETEEEAGIGKHLLDVHEDVKDELQYTVWKKQKQKQKVVTYWLARLTDPQFKVVLSREHQAFKWVDYEEACHLLAEFSDLQDLLGRFQQKLGNMNKS